MSTIDHIFDEYIVQGGTSRRQRAENWQIAIGLQDVDRVKPSPYLLDTAKQHIEGTIDLAAVQKRITAYYQTEEGCKLAANRTDEADKVAIHISEILAEENFSFIPAEYSRLHKRLFDGVFPHTGQYRTVNISKKEWVLDGESVIYAPAELLRETLEYDFAQERQVSYAGLSPRESIKHICKFIAGLWQIHPFLEGNTRTTAVFAILSLRKFGFQVSNEPFKQHSWYFRNALVRANYNNYAQGVAYLYRKDPERIDSFAKSKNTKGIDGYFCTKPKEKYKQVAENVYLFSHTSTWDKLRILKILLDVYGIDDILVTINDEPALNLEQRFEKYLQNTVADKTTDNYIAALHTLESMLLDADCLDGSIFEVAASDKLQTIRDFLAGDADFIAKNQAVHNKYSAAFNQYTDFVAKMDEE